MGLTDYFQDVADTLTNASRIALQTTSRVAEEAQRELVMNNKEAGEIINSVTAAIQSAADEVKRDLEEKVPTFKGKLHEIINDIQEAASVAADEGIDIADSINGIVETFFQHIDKALSLAVDAVNQALHDALHRLSRMLDAILPESANRVLGPVKSLTSSILENLISFAEELKTGASYAVQEIKSTVQGITRKIGEVLSPIWDYVKKLWKLSFGTEPEQCSLTAQWFDERMKRTEHQLL